MDDSPTREARMRVLVFSDDATTRQKVMLAVGRRPAANLPRVEWLECATEPAVHAAVREGGLDVLVLDGEAAPAGGLGICRQLHDEVFDCPPVLVLIARAQDRWLAAWSRAEAVVMHPLDPMKVADAVAGLMRQRLARSPAR